jgi:hypothetical protein
MSFRRCVFQMLGLSFLQLAFFSWGSGSLGITLQFDQLWTGCRELELVRIKNSKSQDRIVRFSSIFYGGFSDSEMTPCS